MISIQHEYSDGWHHFTSEEVPGFYLIATDDDLDAALEDIPVMLTCLIEADAGVCGWDGGEAALPR